MFWLALSSCRKSWLNRLAVAERAQVAQPAPPRHTRKREHHRGREGFATVAEHGAQRVLAQLMPTRSGCPPWQREPARPPRPRDQTDAGEGPLWRAGYGSGYRARVPLARPDRPRG